MRILKIAFIIIFLLLTFSCGSHAWMMRQGSMTMNVNSLVASSTASVSANSLLLESGVEIALEDGTILDIE